MSELTSTRIRTTAAKLGLPHLAEALNQYVQRADEAKMGYLDLLDLVLSEALAVRDESNCQILWIIAENLKPAVAIDRGLRSPGR